uniref:(northern house mosquito) hypothetical protein n=1 Tax=Culex pipiens TaxID=7175 RepID=A0A8D8G481_CULPI
MIKWPGVRASYESGDAESWHKGREFKHASICVKTVERSSYVSAVFPSTTRRCFFILFTAASQIPPMWGADGVMNVHFTLRSDRYWLTARLNSGDCRCSRMCRSAPTKLVPWSDQISLLIPRRANMRLRAAKNALVDRSETASRCTALVARQTKTAT